jgi:hypothetical protein
MQILRALAEAGDRYAAALLAEYGSPDEAVQILRGLADDGH